MMPFGYLLSILGGTIRLFAIGNPPSFAYIYLFLIIDQALQNVYLRHKNFFDSVPKFRDCRKQRGPKLRGLRKKDGFYECRAEPEQCFARKSADELHKSARVCHLHGENLPQHRRLSATSPPPFHQKALPAIPPTELGDTNLLLRSLEYCTAVTFFPKAQCATTACGFQHPSFGRSIAKKRYPCTGTRRLTSALSAFLLAELFTGMEVGRGGLNIPTGWPNLFVQMELRFLDVRLCRFRP